MVALIVPPIDPQQVQDQESGTVTRDAGRLTDFETKRR